MPASEVYSDAGIIAITPGSTNPQITERGMSDMFRMCGRDDQQGQVASDFIIDKLKAKRVVIIHDKDTYGQAGGRHQSRTGKTRRAGRNVRRVIPR